MDNYFLEGQGVLEEELSEVRAQIAAALFYDKSSAKGIRLCNLLSGGFHDEKTKAR